MSDLRTRIAVAISNADGGDDEPDFWDYRLADAVIQEIGLPDGTDDLGNQAILDWFASMEKD